ncbi:hypothetical protein [Polaribacter sp. SA4-12]|uniref:hypothetical protein n=1 Tax=Polaribacter sp. SA4-12 TaxID=1312072 RepID=UPI000B3CB7EB|nr:hypothetical protein [Polaribacter sp. SA4-12]ARV13718.1 hypothetical protein BTO07_00545 [Polaribacter sp. SA4-12]
MDWIKIASIASISLQFISFWFAAPEVLGSEWLQKAEAIIRKVIKTIPGFLMLILGGVIGVLTPKALTGFNLKVLIPLILLFIITIIFSKKLQKILDEKISVPLLNKLIINQSFRFSLLKTAALLFTLGFIIQIITIIYS